MQGLGFSILLSNTSPHRPLRVNSSHSLPLSCSNQKTVGIILHTFMSHAICTYLHWVWCQSSVLPALMRLRHEGQNSKAEWNPWSQASSISYLGYLCGFETGLLACRLGPFHLCSMLKPHRTCRMQVSDVASSSEGLQVHGVPFAQSKSSGVHIPFLLALPRTPSLPCPSPGRHTGPSHLLLFFVQVLLL